MKIRFVFLALALFAFGAHAQSTPNEIVLVEPKSVTEAAVKGWKTERFKGVAVVLDDSSQQSDLTQAAAHVSQAGLDLYYWIEVGRNPQMATKNPLWMASLGMHGDWLRNHPKFPEPGVGEVAKAFPWVPIAYEEAFQAHLVRIEQLLKKVPATYHGLLINDLQGGPSSCGCGNLQCRWAIDYHVPATAKKLEGHNIAARFIAEVRQRAGNKQIVPVWTTECSEADLPASKNKGKAGTGFCGSVGCAHSACEEVFAGQWPFLSESSPIIALLATHTAFQRTQLEFGGGPGWLTNAVDYVHQTLKLRGSKPFLNDRLWVVVDGSQTGDETIARGAAAKAGVNGIVVARVKIDQSYEPRIVKIKP